MCSCVVLAGNWVLLIFVRGRRFCSGVAHMHINPLYELNTCPWLCSPNSSLACCLKLPVSITKTGVGPLPSPRPNAPNAPSRPRCDLVTDGDRYDAFVSRHELWNLRGKHAAVVSTDFTHPQGLLPIRRDCLSFCCSYLFLAGVMNASPVTGRLSFISPQRFISCFYFYFNLSIWLTTFASFLISVSLINTLFFFSMIGLCSGEFLHIALCSFPISDLSDGFLSSPTLFLLLSSSCFFCAALLVSVSIGSVCVCVCVRAH